MTKAQPETPLARALRDYIERTGESPRSISLRVGKNETLARKVLNGDVQHARADTIAALAAVIGVPVSELVADRAPPLPPGVQRGAAGLKRRTATVENPAHHAPSPAMIEIAELDVRPQGGAGADMPALNGDGEHHVVGTWSIPADYLRAFVVLPEAVRIVRVAGDSMEPDYAAGDRVMVDTSHQVPSPPGVYVLWDGFGLVLKRVEIVLGTAPARIRLSSINPAYQPYEMLLSEVHINGRVVGKWVWR